MFHNLLFKQTLTSLLKSGIFKRMGEGLAGVNPVSCYTMIRKAVERHTDHLAIVDRDRQEDMIIHALILPVTAARKTIH
jgi:hypothetical protein